MPVAIMFACFSSKQSLKERPDAVRVLQSCVGFTPKCLIQVLLAASNLCVLIITLCVRLSPVIEAGGYLLTVLHVEVLQASVGCTAMFFCCKSSPVLEAGGFNNYIVLEVIPGVRSRWPLQCMCVCPFVAQYA